MSDSAAARINTNGADGYMLDVQVWDKGQARYLVHGLDDVLWTDRIEDVAAYIAAELKRIEAAKVDV